MNYCRIRQFLAPEAKCLPLSTIYASGSSQTPHASTHICTPRLSLIHHLPLRDVFVGGGIIVALVEDPVDDLLCLPCSQSYGWSKSKQTIL